MARPCLLGLSLVLLVGAPGPGCGHDEPVLLAPPPAETGPTVSFVSDEPLALAPGQQVTLRVQVDPATASTRVRFALLGASGDASLDSGSAMTDASGQTGISLQAPRQVRQFQVRASLDDGSVTTRDVAVNTMGLVTVRVTGLYTGDRPHPTWTATVEASTGGCQATPGTPIATAQGTPLLSLPGIPTGQPLLVRLRSGEAITGCTPVMLTPADDGRLIEVSTDNTPITVNRPLLMKLDAVPESIPWSNAISGWQGRFRAAFLGGQVGDPVPASSLALLDTMVLLAPASERAALQTARKSLGWNTLATAHFLQSTGPAVALTWLGSGAERLRALDPSTGKLLDPITGKLQITDGSVAFSPDNVLGLGSDDALSTKPGLWSTTPDDKVQASSEVSLWPTRLLGRAAEKAMNIDRNAGSATLRQQTDCHALATALGGAEGCSTDCLASLCDQAVGEMWTRAVDSDRAVNAPATLSFVASGAATLAGARLTTFSGSWIGTFKDTQGTSSYVSFSGNATAIAFSDTP